MNVAGLSKLELPPQANKASKGTASKGDEGKSSSFAGLLGQSDGKSNNQTSAKNSSNGQEKSNSNQTSVRNDRPRAEAKNSAGQSSTPISNIEPKLGGPDIKTRSLSTPIVKAEVKSQGKEPAMLDSSADSVSSLTRRVVWNDFLRKMNDLGVSAEDVVQAFTTLSDEELAQPPDQSVDKVVMALGLNPQESKQAEQYFTELIKRTDSKSLGDELNSSSNQINLTLMSQREVERKALAKSLANLEKNFFMQPNLVKPPVETPLPPNMSQRQDVNSSQSNDQMGAAELSTTAMPSLVVPEMVGPGLPDPAPVATGAESAMASLLEQPHYQKAPPTTEQLVAMLKSPKEVTDEEALANELAAADLNPQVEDSKKALAKELNSKMNAIAAAPMVASDFISSAGSTVGKVASAPLNVMPAISGVSGLGSRMDKKSGEGSEEGAQDPSSMIIGPQVESRSTIADAGKATFAAKLNEIGQKSGATVPEVIENAQMMIRDGGGEMKVTLRPDGLGEVAMRVSVDDGKVNVHMITESDEAKKLMERSLGDLKSSLSHSNLNVDSIKIDTATDLGRQLEQQYNEAQRQMARQNLEQFRQDQQGWRRSFFDVPGAKNYSSQSEAPRDVSAPSDSTNKQRERSRRLDLVA